MCLGGGGGGDKMDDSTTDVGMVEPLSSRDSRYMREQYLFTLMKELGAGLPFEPGWVGIVLLYV